MPTKTAGTPIAGAAALPRSGPSAIPEAWAVEWTPRAVPSRPSGAVSYWRAPSAGSESADAKPPANSRMGGIGAAWRSPTRPRRGSRPGCRRRAAASGPAGRRASRRRAGRGASRYRTCSSRGPCSPGRRRPRPRRGEAAARGWRRTSRRGRSRRRVGRGRGPVGDRAGRSPRRARRRAGAGGRPPGLGELMVVTSAGERNGFSRLRLDCWPAERSERWADEESTRPHARLSSP